jgi:adenylyl cyclase-associated protein
VLAPPPPPPPAAAGGGASTDDAASALFAEIEALGEGGLRGGLKKATRGPVNDESPVVAAPKATPAPAKPPAKVLGEPKCELQGKKWVVEYQTGNKEIFIESSMKQTLYAVRV